MQYFNHLLEITKDFSALAYFIITALAFFESSAFIGLIIPGSVAVIVGGFLASQGILDIGDLFVLSALGAIFGDILSFYLGGKGIIAFRKSSRLFKPSVLKNGEKFFKKHGEKSVFFGRFIGWVRPVIPFIAGLFKMDVKRFIVWNVLSGFLWAAVHIAIGYLFGGALTLVELWSTRVGVVIFSFIAAWLIIHFLIRKGGPLMRFIVSILGSIKSAVISNPDSERLVKKHPRFFGFLKGRVNDEVFWGLPLTLLVIAFAYVLFLFLGVVESFVTSEAIVSVDMRVANLLHAFRDIELVNFFVWITLLAKWEIIFTSAVVVSVLLWIWKRRIYILPFWVTILGADIFYNLGKIAFHRPRPDVALFVENSYSFPSGHATMAVAFYGFLIYLLLREADKWRYKINLSVLSFLTILAVGASRLYFGVHYLSDVWSGYLLGILWLLIGIAIAEWLRRRKKFSVNKVERNTKIISAALILVDIMFYIGFGQSYKPVLASPPMEEIVVASDALSTFEADNLPRFTETLTAAHQEPLSFMVVAKDDASLIYAMENAGWYLADPATPTNLIGIAKAAIDGRDYFTAPMTPSFWNAEVHNLGFEKPTDANNVSERHHARFWRTDIKTQDGKNVYVATASQDVGIKWLVAHTISPDIDTEREFLFSDLESTGEIKSYTKEHFVDPTLGKNFTGDQFFTDGELYFIVLK